jgi:(2R)-3-sulfolactate dehydrogenase (NADP+)
MLPLGDAKGTALALMVELLAAGLTGANYAADASSFLDDRGAPPGTGQLLIALDPAMIGGKGTLQHFRRLAEQIRSQEGARLPGARRIALRARAKAEGIAITPALRAEIEAL